MNAILTKRLRAALQLGSAVFLVSLVSCVSTVPPKAVQHDSIDFEQLIRQRPDWITADLIMLFGSDVDFGRQEVQEAHEILFHNDFYKHPNITPVEIYRVSTMAEAEAIEPFKDRQTADAVGGALKNALMCSICLTPSGSYYLLYNHKYELIKVIR